MTVSGTDLFSEQDGLWGELGFGGSYNWDDDKYAIFGEGSVMTSLADFGDSYALKGTAGFRIKGDNGERGRCRDPRNAYVYR